MPHHTLFTLIATLLAVPGIASPDHAVEALKARNDASLSHSERAVCFDPTLPVPCGDTCIMIGTPCCLDPALPVGCGNGCIAAGVPCCLEPNLPQPCGMNCVAADVDCCDGLVGFKDCGADIGCVPPEWLGDDGSCPPCKPGQKMCGTSCIPTGAFCCNGQPDMWDCEEYGGCKPVFTPCDKCKASETDCGTVGCVPNDQLGAGGECPPCPAGQVLCGTTCVADGTACCGGQAGFKDCGEYGGCKPDADACDTCKTGETDCGGAGCIPTRQLEGGNCPECDLIHKKWCHNPLRCVSKHAACPRGRSAPARGFF